MKNSILKTLTMSLLTLAALICLGGCGAEATGGEEEALTVQEEKALTDEFALEAIETIDEKWESLDLAESAVKPA